jgi:hypothetical protein
MKRKLTAIPLLLVAVVLVISTALNSSVRAKEVKTVTITDAVAVAGTVLLPDTYKVEWNGTGPQVQVSFMKGHKILATASATLVLEKNPFDRSVEMKTLPDNTKVLERISFKHSALIFGQA